jgi:hypothetical protein
MHSASWLRILGTTTWKGGGKPVYDHIGRRGDLISYGEGGGGEATQRQPLATLGNPWHPVYLQNTPRLAPWCRTTRRCPVRWAAADFPRETAALWGNPPEALAPGPDHPAAPSKLGPADSLREQPQPGLRRRSKGNTRQHLVRVLSDREEHRAVTSRAHSC